MRRSSPSTAPSTGPAPLLRPDRPTPLRRSAGCALEQEVHVVARVGNVLVTVDRPADDATRAHRLVAAIAEQLRAGS